MDPPAFKAYAARFQAVPGDSPHLAVVAEVAEASSPNGMTPDLDGGLLVCEQGGSAGCSPSATAKGRS